MHNTYTTSKDLSTYLFRDEGINKSEGKKLGKITKDCPGR